MKQNLKIVKTFQLIKKNGHEETIKFFKNCSKKNISFCFKICSGEIKDKQANFCPAMDLSSSNKSTYLAFSVPSGFFCNVTPSGDSFKFTGLEKLIIIIYYINI